MARCAASSNDAPALIASVSVAMTVSPAPVTSAIWSDPTIGMCLVGSIRLEQRHAAAAARDQHRRRARLLQQRAAGPFEHAEIVADPDAERVLDLGLVWRAGGDAAVAQQAVARVQDDRHRRRGAARAESRRRRPGVISPLP